MNRARLDLFAVTSSGLAVVMVISYLWLIRQESDQPVGWFLAALIVGGLLAAYGAFGAAPYRRAVLALAAMVLLALGILAILSIGLPILVAGALSLFAATRSWRPASLAADDLNGSGR